MASAVDDGADVVYEDGVEPMARRAAGKAAQCLGSNKDSTRCGFFALTCFCHRHVGEWHALQPLQRSTLNTLAADPLADKPTWDTLYEQKQATMQYDRLRASAVAMAHASAVFAGSAAEANANYDTTASLVQQFQRGASACRMH
jgi:hypothetical protein